jgi:hypothetical protein
MKRYDTVQAMRGELLIRKSVGGRIALVVVMRLMVSLTVVVVVMKLMMMKRNE